MISTMDGAQLCSMMRNAAACVEQHKQQINELNVFPVPDGDTGTNMSLTLCAAATDLQSAGALSLGAVAGAAASALLRGARGNSGVITSLLFRGFAKYLKGLECADGYQFAAALSEGVETAYKAVMKPAEGTILTVSRVCAEKALEEAVQNRSLEHVLEFCLSASRTALEETVNQNPVLKKAGVVDAGGMGFFYILEGMLKGLRGEVVEVDLSGQAPKAAADFTEFATEDITFGYCTEFIVSRENDKDPELLRSFLGELGDSLVLVADDEIIKVHVHTNHPGAALEEALTYGGFVTVKVENMRLQHTEKVMDAQELKPAETAAPEKKYGIVTVCSGAGIRSVFADLGVDGFVEGGQTMNPSTEDILQQINRTPAEIVLVLPNNKNIIMAAQQTIPLTDKQVVVIPTTTVCQGITALLNFDAALDLEANEDAMTEAMQAVSTIQITYAARNSDFDGVQIREGDYLALYNGALLATNADLSELLQAVAARVDADGKEYITVFCGADTSAAQKELAQSIFQGICTDAEISVIDGGQPVYYFLISAE